jgi:hypothetical protein
MTRAPAHKVSPSYDERRSAVSSKSATNSANQIAASYVADSYGLGLHLTWVSRTTTNVFYKAGLRAVASAPKSMSRFNELAGFTLREVIPSAYQLIPYSFLVDYFSNLGDVIEGAFTDVSNVFWATRTTRIQTTVEIYESWQIDPDKRGKYAYHGDLLVGKTNSVRVFERTTMARTDAMPLQSIPLVVKLPQGDSQQWVNIVALLAQAAKFRFK